MAAVLVQHGCVALVARAGAVGEQHHRGRPGDLAGGLVDGHHHALLHVVAAQFGFGSRTFPTVHSGVRNSVVPVGASGAELICRSVL